MKRGHGQRGAVIPMVAISLTVLMGFSGLAIDVGFLEYRQQQQQSAADAAAVGGAQKLASNSCTSTSGVQSAALTDAATNGFASPDVSVDTPPSSGPYAGNACAVAVTINHTQPTMFAHLFGMTGQESTSAVAAAVKVGSGCIYLLSTTTESNFNKGSLTAPGCGLMINDTANFNGASIDASTIGYAGAAPNTNGATFTGASPAPMLPVADPCPEIAGCAGLAASPPPSSSCPAYTGPAGTAGSPVTITGPACYSDLQLNKGNAILSGTIVLTGTSSFSMATLTSGTSGATIYVTQSATPPNFNKTTVNLSAPTTGPYAGVAYYQVPGNSASPNFNSSSSNYNGLIYAPSATDVNFNKNGTGYAILVIGAGNFNMGTNFAASTGTGSIIYQSVLTQ
ncbi:MAG: pilus assembly protein TadG-related protein [Candidatus Cybelea sp.]